MLSFGAISFAGPWFLFVLGVLSLLWWLLWATLLVLWLIVFPVIRLLFGFVPIEETLVHMSWWLLLLWLVIVGLVIVGLVWPILNVGVELVGAGPLLLVIDDGWVAVVNWEWCQNTMLVLIEKVVCIDWLVCILMMVPVVSGQSIFVLVMMTVAEVYDVI